MSKYRDEVIEKIARYIYNENMNATWEMLNEKSRQSIKESFIKFVNEMFREIPELAIVVRIKPEHLESYHPDMQEKIKHGWVKEINE